MHLVLWWIVIKCLDIFPPQLQPKQSVGLLVPGKNQKDVSVAVKGNLHQFSFDRVLQGMRRGACCRASFHCVTNTPCLAHRRLEPEGRV